MAATLLGLHWWTIGRFMVDTDNAYVRADVVTIAPRVAGNLAEVAVADNQRVHAGDVLARIDDRDYRIAMDKAQGAVIAATGDVAAQQARIAVIEAQAARQQDVIAQARATITAHQADAGASDLDYQRQADLLRQAVGSAQHLEAARAAAQKARAGLTEARAGLSAARALLPVLAAQRRSAIADLDKARGVLRQMQAMVEAARLDLQRTVIRAPADGEIGQRSARAGQYADVGTPLMALVPAEAYVVANFKETQTDRIAPRQRVRIEVDALGGASIRGRVESLAPATGAQFALLPPDNATGNFTKIVQRIPLRIAIEPGQMLAARLRPGMSVEASVDTRGGRP